MVSNIGKQSGIALIVALLLLVIISLIGLAAVRGTIMQQKMASNMYDRELSFQSAEAALRVAEKQLLSNPNASFIRDCGPTGANACRADPFTDPNLPNNSIQNVARGTGITQYSASGLLTGQPQFIVENMGTFLDPTNVGLNQTANSMQYGGGGSGQSYTYFRITARSSDPTNLGARAIVTLQSVVKQ